ncbi:hypothetical protein DBP19_36615 [Streptomyces sp. CS090A]|nr:hypothetical protein DBP19_36615 [Streptomyces sp. CS090A]
MVLVVDRRLLRSQQLFVREAGQVHRLRLRLGVGFGDRGRRRRRGRNFRRDRRDADGAGCGRGGRSGREDAAQPILVRPDLHHAPLRVQGPG